MSIIETWKVLFNVVEGASSLNKNSRMGLETMAVIFEYCWNKSISLETTFTDNGGPKPESLRRLLQDPKLVRQ